MQYLIDLKRRLFKGPVPEGERISDYPDTDLTEIFQSVDRNSWFESGLIPCSGSGLLSYRKAAGYEQFVYQIEPGIYPVRWGQYENDTTATNYMLAHPWRIVIGDFFEGNLLGVRHFYTLNPIAWWGEQLYAINLPNTNTRGYRGTSVGWVCLYHRHDTRSMTPGERIEYMLHREAGLSEPYNNANMSSTDGPRFYESHHAPTFITNPLQWHKKTEAEGYQWILDEKLLIPLCVAENEHAQMHTPEAPVYTLERAMFEDYSAYYSDKCYDKPFNVLHRQGYTGNIDFVNTLFNAPVLAPAPVVVKTDPQEFFATSMAPKYTDKALSYTKSGWICSCCDVKYPYVDQEPEDVVVEYKIHPATFNGSTSFDTLQHQWCHLCRSENAVVVDVPRHPFPEAMYVSTHLLTWSGAEDEWLFPELSYSCPDCGEAYTTRPNEDLLIYDGQTKYIVGCVSCINDRYFVVDSLTGKYIYKDHAIQYSRVEILVNPSDPFLSNSYSIPLSASISKKALWVAETTLAERDLKVCACDILVAASNPHACVGCDIKPLVSRISTWEQAPDVPIYSAAELINKIPTPS